MPEEFVLEELTEISPHDLESLSRLLVDVVADGAAVGFLPPITPDEAATYWQSVLAPDAILWVARWQGEIVGSIQLHLATKANGTHRAEIAKLMVHPTARRKGIAQHLMAAAESRARSEARTLLILDTRAGDPSNTLYRSLGYTEAGQIPHYARSADGTLHTTVLYYKSFPSD
ncbi:GNAT family N-acetyltransferase [Tumebacillus sp. DT12]|uniref:GNAT family N-acetyltransferase n=1 Tax=Tumebacillus lacus TaxID=2995335 RepID=A0ABT3WXA0_9BACL|nr:GNAT family N-acetyltransferase [Tumebacillus lacus]MCX7569298.1 GNAT family N-acetyltransferase [Tumebacillus lacus]